MKKLLFLLLSLTIISCDLISNNDESDYNPYTSKNVIFRQVGTGDLLTPVNNGLGSDNYMTVVHNDSLWSFNTKHSYVSTDGETWVDLGVKYKDSCSGVHLMDALFSFKEKIWLIYDEYVYNTSDGRTWKHVSSNSPANTISAGISCVIFEGKIWLIGGKANDTKNSVVYNSTDGIRWDLITGSSGISSNCNHQSVVFNNRMWIVGGLNFWNINGNSDWSNEVWSSADGIYWEESKEKVYWEARDNFGLNVFRDTLWIVGGRSEYDCLNDVWFSSDGLKWYKCSNAISFSKRQSHALFTFRNSMWLVAGRDRLSNEFGDVWRYP